MPGGINPPLAVILSWPKPNYVNPETRNNSMLFVACILGPITVVMLLARLWVRIVHQRTPGWDDWLMLVATVPTIALTVLLPLTGIKGFGRHVWDFDPIKESGKLVTSRKYVLAVECIFCVASGLIKISILLFYRRLSSRVVSNTFRWTTWITIGTIAGYTIALTITPLVGCQPVSAYWDQVDIFKRLRGYKYHCFDEGLDLFAAAVISAAQDLLTAVLPTFLYWNLQVPLRKKIALFGIFALGYGVVGTGALRAYYTWRTFYQTYDVTWSTYDLFFTTMVELHLGAFCANAPTMKVFFKKFFHDKSNSHNRNDSAQPGSKTSKSSSSLFKRFASKIGSSHSSKGYISETNTSVSVDAYGVVKAQKEVDVTRFPALAMKPTKKHDSVNTINLLNQHYYNNDIEMRDYKDGITSETSSKRSTMIEGTDFSALPPMWTATNKTQSLKSFGPSTSRAPDSETQRMSLPDAIPEQEERNTRRLTPMPTSILNQPRPMWQSWV